VGRPFERREPEKREFGENLSGKKSAVVLLLAIIVLLVACGGQGSETSSNDPGTREASRTQQQEATSAASSEKSIVEETTEGKTGPSGEDAELARAEVGKRRLARYAGDGGFYLLVRVLQVDQLSC
jgi:hypothetical protein